MNPIEKLKQQKEELEARRAELLGEINSKFEHGLLEASRCGGMFDDLYVKPYAALTAQIADLEDKINSESEMQSEKTPKSETDKPPKVSEIKTYKVTDDFNEKTDQHESQPTDKKSYSDIRQEAIDRWTEYYLEQAGEQTSFGESGLTWEDFFDIDNPIHAKCRQDAIRKADEELQTSKQ